MRSFFQTVRQPLLTLVQTLALLLAVYTDTATAAPAPAGVFIRNVAETTYYNKSLGLVETVYSNAVETKVAAVADLEVTGYSDLLLTRGAFAQYYFDILNTGNIPLEASMLIKDRSGPFVPGRGRLIADLNNNGRIDPNEGPLDKTMLQPGDRTSLIYEFAVAFTATLGDELTAQLDVIGTPVGIFRDSGPVQRSASGKAFIVDSALELEKVQQVRETDEKTYLTYTLNIRNNFENAVGGYNTLSEDKILIDGVHTTGVLVRDSMPLNTVFHSLIDAGGMDALYHREGDPAHTYQTARPELKEDIDAIAFFAPGDYDVGRSSDPSFMVTLAAGLGDVGVVNTAQAFLDASGASLTLASNSTRYERQDAGFGQLRFEVPYKGTDQEFTNVGNDTQLRLIAGACNLTDGIDTALIQIRSAATGDTETLIASETSNNTGIFLTQPLPIVSMIAPVQEDNVLAATRGDKIIAETQCGNFRLNDELFVNPGNFLFNAITNDPISDVTIRLIDHVTGAEVAKVVTDSLGFFSFGRMEAGHYHYEIDGGPNWQFPSTRTSFNGFDRRVAAAGHGKDFRHSNGMMFVSDIPVDPQYALPLLLEKTANRTTVGTGEFVTYTLKLINKMDQALQFSEILDDPAFGSQYVAGSAVLDGTTIADPLRNASGQLTFSAGTLEPLSEYTLTYVMQFTAAAREGDNINTAILSGRQVGTGMLRQSQIEQASVTVDNSGGVFSREGTVIGSVFMDCDQNGIRNDENEPGIPGVRIVTQEGLSIVTDREGKYSLFGLRPVTHAFVLQDETLPAGTSVSVTRTNDLLRGGSRLVPLKRGEMRSEHFAVNACTPVAMDEVAARQNRMESEAQPYALTAGDLPIEAQRSPQRSSRSEAGIATTTQMTANMLRKLEEVEQKAQLQREKPDATATRQRLDALIKSLDDTAGFIDLNDGQTVNRGTQNIRIKGAADLTLSLSVNDRPLGSDRVGERLTWAQTNVQALEYVAVKLSPGQNTLAIIGSDDFGIERSRHEITISAPGKPAKFEIIMPDNAAADPASIVPVVIRALDARGLPVPASGTVTLTARRALWDVTDIRSGTPGVQAYFDNGEATFDLIPPQIAGTDRIAVTGAFGTAEAIITFTPNLDQRLLVGVVEGAIALGEKNGTLLAPGRFTSFEDTTTGLRGEVYLKGVIRGDALLTLRYSSDRDTEDRLFRDIRGDEYYPVYGDNAERGVDAQSSENLFVKVEKGRSYILYGDIAIEPEASAFKLDGLRRVATGTRAAWEGEKVSVTVFAAHTAQEQAIVEIPGRGVSGPYDIDLGTYIDGSERIEIIVRDKDAGDVIASTSLRRGTDYLLDFFRNTLTFDAPVSQFDADRNPVSIRVTYEVEAAEAERYWLYGSEVNYALSDNVTIGARAIHADADIANPARGRSQSAYVRIDGELGGTWEAEVSATQDAVDVADNAVRLSYDIQTVQTRFNIEAVHAGANYLSRGGLALAGSTRARLTYGFDIDASSNILFNAEYANDRLAALERMSIDILYGRQIKKQLRLEAGIEYEEEFKSISASPQASAVIGAHWSPLSRPGTVIETKLRFPVYGNGQTTDLTLGLYKEPLSGWRAYNEVALRFGDDKLMTHSKLGFTYDMNAWLSGRTELSKNAGDDNTMFHQGLNTEWKANENTEFNFSIEHHRRMDDDEHELTSLAVGAKWNSGDGNWVGDADFDTTIESDGPTYYGSVGLAGQINADLTILGRTRIAIDKRDGQRGQRSRTRTGIAYRPVSDPRLELLAWYENRQEEKRSRSVSHLWSVDAGYELDQDLRLNGKYAGQYEEITITETLDADAKTQLVQAGFEFDFLSDRLMFGMNAAYLWDDSGNSTSGIGAEIGLSPAAGTLLVLGYNKADSLSAHQGNLYHEGFYLRMKLLLDNSLWDQLDSFLDD